MKLHKNRKRNKWNKLISLALVCCMTLSMGSSYVSAGEMNAATESSEATQESQAAEPAASQDEGADGQNAGQDTDQNVSQDVGGETDNDAPGIKIEETLSGTDQEQQPSEDTGGQLSGSQDDSKDGSIDGTSGSGSAPSGDTGGQPASDGNQDPTQNTGNTADETGEPDADKTASDDIKGQEPGAGNDTGEGNTDDVSQDPADGNQSGTGSTDEGNTGTQPQQPQWSFDAYYVDEADRYNVTKTDDFSLKYQMEFHASSDFAAGTVKVKVDAALFENRNWRMVTPDDIGVPPTNWDENGNPVGNASRSTSFNYYYASADESVKRPSYSQEASCLVFYNYQEIPSGTNAVWQVLYKNQQLMDIIDETNWTIIPEISVNGGETYASENELKGRVNSSVYLNSVVKTPYYEAGKKYAPGLYTLDQLSKYVENVYNIDSKYIRNGKLNTEDYRYVVWDVKIAGSATQPWELSVLDTPGVEGKEVKGEVVGYKDNSDPTTNYKYAVDIWSTNSNSGNYDQAVNYGQEKTWGNRFWVVTAYDAKEVEANTTVKNDFTVKLHPVDGKDEDVIVEATPSTWSYKNYDWTYEGDIIGATKKNGWNSANDNIEYTGWLEAYKRAKEKGDDYGEIPFTVTGRMKGYEITHHVQGADLGAYKTGTYYTLTTVDDFIYMFDGKGNEHLLGVGDYYFSSVTINQTDYGYDIYEDKEIASERQALINAGKLQNFDSSVKVYAMYGKTEDKVTENTSPGWELVGTAQMDGEGKASYVFDENQIAREPFRVKVEHNSIDYRTVCEIKLAVRIKAESDAMQQIVDARNEGAEYEVSPQIQFENISGVIGTGHNADGSITVFQHKEQTAGEETEGEGSGAGNSDGEDSNEENTQNTHEGKAESNGFNYDGRDELKAQTQNLYNNNLLVRDSASRTVTWLNMTSQANKKYTSNNDAKNNRVLVDYYLTAYDGYEIYDRSCLDYLKKSDQELISPGRKHVVFYDLLPYGMQFDASTPVTAGRIKELDSKGNYMTKTRSWDSTQVTVTVDPDKDIIQNYKGTGRTMVAFHIAYSGGDSASYTSGKWIEGWGVSFRAYYEWKNMESINKVDANANLCAFMPDFSEGYIDAINRSNPMLYGLRDSVYADNGVIEDTGKAAVYKDLLEGKTGAGGWVGNIDNNTIYDKYTVEENGEQVEKWYRNVLYAEEKLNDYVATSSESKIKKLVRADEDQFGTFRESTTVSEGGTYTYETTVSADENDIQGIVVFDHLENAAVDREHPTDGKADPFSPFENATWKGKFLAVDLSALEKQGITGTTVYYNESRIAAVPVEGENPYDVLNNTGNGWYEQSAFESAMQQKYGESYTKWTDYVQAVAVSFRDDYVLPKDSSASFRIQMEVPDDATSGGYAYNSVSFSSYMKDQENTRKIVSSNSVRVGVSPSEKLEIVKRTTGVVPEDFQDATFTFRLHEKYTTGGELQYLAFQAYDLYKEGRDGTWTKQEGELHATDENGYLYLKAGEKAVFTIADTDRVVVEEKSNVFWESNPAPGETVNEDGEFVNEVVYREDTVGEGENTKTVRVQDDSGNIHVRTWTNTYRPVLYAQKRLLAVPEDVNLTDADKTFTFKLWVKKNGEYQPLANAEFWYVDGVPADGGIPIRVNRDGEVWTDENSVADTKRTGADGTFSIREGQTIALFPGTVGTEYKLTEENMDADGYGPAGNAIWYCPVMAETDEGDETGVTDTVRVEGNSESITNYYRWKDLYITKKITHQDPAECTRKFTFRITELQLDANGELVKDAQGNVIEVKKTNAEGQEVQVTEGLTWELLDAQIPETIDETEGTSGEGSPTSGTLNGNGEFTCALAGKTVRIKGLEAGKYYVVKETAIEAEADGTVLYRPVNDTAEFKMPAYSVKKEVSITNDYLKRPLSLTKTVSGDSKPDANAEPFKFTIKVNDQPLPAGISYTVKEQGTVIENGIGTTDGTGIFCLRDGQTVTFKDAGMLGDSFEITETPYDGYTQTYPVNGTTPVPATGTLSGEGGEASFVNGTANALRISKDYVEKTDDPSAAVIVAAWKNKIHDWQSGGTTISNYSDECAAEFILEVTDESGTYIWPKGRNGSVAVTGMNQQTGTTSTFEWQRGKSIKLPPWFTLSIEFGNGDNQIPQNATYTLTEVESSRKRIIKSDDNYFQISQKYPANEGSITGVAASAPNATIVNEISTLPNLSGSRVGKRMTSASSEVPTGQELVWRLEECQNGIWSPKEGIEYAVFDEEGTPISNEMKKTGTDGKVVLTKTEGHWPEVRFRNATVYINPSNMPTENGTLRLVEVPQESGSGWGMLVGYGTSAGGSYSWDGGNTVEDGEARVFYNSNKKASIKIEKYMETRSYQEFTMILKQVVAINGSASEIMGDNYGEKIIKSEPREGVSYTIHNTDGTEVTGNKSGTTGAGGEIRLKAGQYVILDVPDGTVWTVAEDVYTTQNYQLTDLSPEIKEPGGKLTWLDDNLMLINLPAAVRYTLVYDGNGERVTDVPAPMTIEADSTDESATFTIASMIPKKGGYVFKGWATDRNAEASYQPGEAISIGSSEVTKTLYAVWEKETYHHKLVVHGNGGTVYEETEHTLYEAWLENTSVTIGLSAASYNAERDGYTLLGWSTDPNATVPEYGLLDNVPAYPSKDLYAIWGQDKIVVWFDPSENDINKDYQSYFSNFSATLTITDSDGDEVESFEINKENATKADESQLRLEWLIPSSCGDEVLTYKIKIKNMVACGDPHGSGNTQKPHDKVTLTGGYGNWTYEWQSGFYTKEIEIRLEQFK